MNGRFYKMIGFLRELVVWQLFFLAGVYTAGSFFVKLVNTGDGEHALNMYLGGVLIAFGLWLRAKERSEGRAFRGIPAWVHQLIALLNLPLGIMMVHKGDHTGYLLIAASLMLFLSSFLGGYGEDDGGGGDEPKNDGPKPPGKKLPLDWWKGRKPVTSPTGVSSN